MLQSRIACAIFLVASLAAQQSQPPASNSVAAAQPPAPAQHGFLISGLAVNSLTGQPIAGASVAIARLAQGTERDVSNSVITAADGRFSFSSLSQGKYSLMATARGYSLQYFDRHDIYATAIAVGPGLDSEHLVFRLQPDASLEGVITDENNDPIQYAMVRLFQSTTEDGQQKTRPVNQAQTDDQGHYHVGHLAPGAYFLAASARPWYAQNARPRRSPDGSTPYSQSAQEDAALDVTYPLTFYPDATDSANASPLQLAPGERQTANVVMRAVPSLHLRIHTAGSAQGAVIGRMIFPRVSQRLFDGYMDSVYNAPDSWVAPGVIEITGLAPGHYVVELPPSTGANDKGNTKAWYREIDLTGDADINASEGSGFVTVNGTILFENSRVPKRAGIELLNPETGETFRSSINDTGEFDFNSDDVRPGRYLILLGSGQGFYLKKLVATGAKVAGRALEISAVGNVHLAAIASHGQAQVDGTAVREGEPFAGAMIVLVPQDPANNTPLFRRDQSDSDGTFTLSSVVPGQYTVIAIANGWDLEWGNPAVLQPYLKKGETVQVPAEGKLQIKVQVQ
jgi:hypothetical protein